MIIVISGPSGSGKTTVAKNLSKKYNLDFVSAGNIFREFAEKSGKDLITMNKDAEKNFDIDKLIDSKILEKAKKGNVVIESHIAGWLLKDIADFSIYLWAPLEVRAMRISSRDKLSYEDALMKIIEREQSHYFRFWKYYGIDLFDLTPFDIVINTSKISVENTICVISKFIDNYIKKSNNIY
ncbi:AAA family ATPase [Acidianus sulfidivorans JP7]|uniref:Cytidylate kinase n=1 Tax=Acidianus sulfidivorans JP7 TaxID=619593 RepID=A0A2U9IMS6_9CREN|nr:AAA family ATPase [Acidianus sulfidivorans]AWR97307.1 AAA family ATPase [Acidianus sulfidivorans JP7]